MKRNWLLAAGLAVAVVAVGLAGCSPAGTNLKEVANLNISNQQEGILVTGQGKVMAEPDIATLRLGIEAQETSVARAQTIAIAAMDKVMKALTENGVSDKDIQTQRLSIQRVTRWDRDKEQEVVIGYRVTNIVTAKIRDIDKVGTIVDAVAAAGGDVTRIDSISFSIDDPSDYYEDAREKAMADARQKAQQLARLGGVTLGKPTYISEGIQTPRPVYAARAEMAVPAPAPVETQISPGELEIILNLQLVYAIK